MRRVHLAMLALVTVWGFNFALVKATFDELPPLVFNGLRFAIASVLLLLALRRIEPNRIQDWSKTMSEPAARGRVEWWKLFVLGFIGNSAYQLFFILGLARTTAGNSSIILATTPIFIALLGVALGIDGAASSSRLPGYCCWSAGRARSASAAAPSPATS